MMDQLQKVQLSDRPFFEAPAQIPGPAEPPKPNDPQALVGADRLKTATSQREFLSNTLVRLKGAKHFFEEPESFSGSKNEEATTPSDAVVKTAVAAKLMNELTQAALQGQVAKTETISDVLLSMPDISVEQRAVVYLTRGFARIDQKLFQGAIDDISKGLDQEGLPLDLRVMGLLHRGVAYEALGQGQTAIAEFNKVIEMQGVPESSLAMALVSRGAHRIQSGEDREGIKDFTQAAELPGAAGATRARALYNRGVRAFASARNGGRRARLRRSHER
jgi:tetratricopeptide (TPR) repeat protein